MPEMNEEQRQQAIDYINKQLNLPQQMDIAKLSDLIFGINRNGGYYARDGSGNMLSMNNNQLGFGRQNRYGDYFTLNKNYVGIGNDNGRSSWNIGYVPEAEYINVGYKNTF